MTHIEDLNINDFINIVKNIQKTEASIKLDGTAAVAFGFDEEGKFYTGFGRDFKSIKPELRRYSANDWLKQKNIYNNPAGAAHIFLESNISIIKKHLKPGNIVLSEVLFGDRPNCIKYKLHGVNHLIILNNDDLAKDLNGIKTNISTINYTVDNSFETVTQTWCFGIIQKIDIKKYDINTDEEIKNLESFLHSYTDGICNIDIVGMRAVGGNKELISNIRNKVECYKIDVKEKLLQQFVRKVKEGEYIPAEGYSHEGIVLKFENQMVKIIDKNVFLTIHDRDWEPINTAKKIQKTMPAQDALVKIDEMIINFSKLYPNIDDDMKIKMQNQLRMTKIFISNKLP